MKKLIPAAALLVVLTLALSVTMPRAYLNQPLETGDAPATLIIKPGASLNSVARQLDERGWFRHPLMLRLYGRFSGTAEQIKAGEYVVPAGITAIELVDLLVAGKVKLHAFTILEGWTAREMLAAISTTDTLEQTLVGSDAETLAAELELDTDNAEGLFFPDTYHFPLGTTDRVLLLQAYALMQQELAAAWEDRAQEGPLENPYELLVLASIVERESAVDAERPEIAGVFVRRLNKGMRLQTDPTVIYGLGTAFDGNLTRRHLRTDNPYNTYTRGGLPPTPIGMPGRSSLLASAHPADGTALYFVASGDEDGGHVFSNTLEEHNKAVQDYLRKLRQASRRSKSTPEEG
ncbi:MAG: endolytic transglycosylase MltG [Thiogranum sp.]